MSRWRFSNLPNVKRPSHNSNKNLACCKNVLQKQSFHPFCKSTLSEKNIITTKIMTTKTSPAGIMGRLKADTAEQHIIAESKPLEADLIEGRIRPEHYRDYLAQRWFIHQELEAATDRAVVADSRLSKLGLPELYQTKNLEADLAHVGVETASLKAHPGTKALTDLIRQADVAPLLGVYYVFEGSKNGGVMVANSLAKAWNRNGDRSGLQYLNPHGDAQRAIWMCFRREMNAIAWTDEEQRAMIQGAQATFDLVAQIDDETYAA